MSKSALEDLYREVWKREIEIGQARGKLVGESSKADLKSVPLRPEDHQALKKMHGK